MKILTVSDTVTKGLLDDSGTVWPDVGLIISCGDLPPEFLTALRHRFDAPLVYILGNHDIRYGEAPPVGCANIDRRLVQVKGLNILGFSGSRWYNGGMNQYTERDMQVAIAKMWFQLWRKGAPDIIVTHAPPRFIHDQEDPCHKGFRSFVPLIERYRPRFFLHGHIHRHFEADSERITEVGSTSVVNSYGYLFFEM